MSSAVGGPKRPRAAASSTDAYELIYWPGIPGRGEFVRLAFEATGTAYADVGNAGGAGRLMALINPGGDDAAAADAGNPPPLAPPVLRHGPLLLAQTAAILAYLGPRLGLVPAEADDPSGRHHVSALALVALDGFSDEAHETHHPIGARLTYEDQKDPALARSREYVKYRLPKFLAYFERVLGGQSSGGSWLYGGALTYADLVMFQGLDGVTHAFPKAIGRLKDAGKHAKVFALYERVKALDKVKAYLESERRMKYGNGIWRHYPELDEE